MKTCWKTRNKRFWNWVNFTGIKSESLLSFTPLSLLCLTGNASIHRDADKLAGVVKDSRPLVEHLAKAKTAKMSKFSLLPPFQFWKDADRVECGMPSSNIVGLFRGDSRFDQSTDWCYERKFGMGKIREEDLFETEFGNSSSRTVRPHRSSQS